MILFVHWNQIHRKWPYFDSVISFKVSNEWYVFPLFVPLKSMFDSFLVFITSYHILLSLFLPLKSLYRCFNCSLKASPSSFVTLSAKQVNVPNELKAEKFPHFMGREDSYHSTSILGKIYDTVEHFQTEKQVTKGEDFLKPQSSF